MLIENEKKKYTEMLIHLKLNGESLRRHDSKFCFAGANF